MAGILGIGLMVGLLSTAKSLGDYELSGDNATRLLVVLQFSVFVIAGIGLLALTITDLWHARDAESALLVLWIAVAYAAAGRFPEANWCSSAGPPYRSRPMALQA